MTASTTPQHTPEVAALLKERNELVRRYHAEDKILMDVCGKQDDRSKAVRFSAGARKANRIKEIRLNTMWLASEGHTEPEFTGTRVTSKPSKGGIPIDKAQAQAKLNKLAKVAEGKFAEGTKKDAKNMIKAIMEKASKQGVELTNPLS